GVTDGTTETRRHGGTDQATEARTEPRRRGDGRTAGCVSPAGAAWLPRGPLRGPLAGPGCEVGMPTGEWCPASAAVAAPRGSLAGGGEERAGNGGSLFCS